MSDDTQIAKMGQSLPKTNQPQQPIQANLNQYGNESTQIAYVQHYDATTNQTVLIMQGTQPASGTVIGQGVTFNYDCFNFFVLGTEQYDGATFMVPKNRALTESTSDEMKAQCAALTPEAIEIVKTFPALFCSENHYFTKTDPDHMAYYGYVTDIKVQDSCGPRPRTAGLRPAVQRSPHRPCGPPLAAFPAAPPETFSCVPAA